MDGLARSLRDSSPGELMGHVEDLARRQPVAFFGAAVLAGFAMARFAKSSADEARRSSFSAGQSAYRQTAIGGGSGSAAIDGDRRPWLGSRRSPDAPMMPYGLPPWPRPLSAVRGTARCGIGNWQPDR